MSGHSAAALLDAFLADGSSQSIATLAESLATDPPLTLWTTYSARRRSTLEPKSVADLANWLVVHGLEVLDWKQEPAVFPAAWGGGESQGFADQVENDLQVADLAALAVSRDGTAVAEEARLVGLLHGAPQWLALASVPGESPRTDSRHGEKHDPHDPAAEQFLASLTVLDRQPAAGHVAEVVEILAGKRPAEAVHADLLACRHRAAVQRDRWLEAVPCVSHLPGFTRKLRRLNQLERQFQETLEIEKLDAMAEFAAGAGHEINNPLAVIGGRAQLFLREETDPERRRELALMNAQVKRAYEMIADMRLFARPPKPELDTFDLIALVDRVLVDLAPLAADRAILLFREGDSGPLDIEADPVQIHVALRALCTNSFEAIGHDGHVGIAIHRAGEDVQMQVADDGPGILPEHRRHIFDPFFSARQAGRGLGLGLSKCWRIVTNHGGRIEVESQPRHGATFTITLPCRQSRG